MTVARPICGKCGGRMVKFGHRPSGRQRYRCLVHRRPASPKPSRPACQKCGARLSKNGHAPDGNQQYLCPRRRLHPDALDTLMRRIAAALPGYLSADEREDARQSIMLDVLTGDLPPAVPAPLTLRRYAAEARGLVGDRYRFISLSQPTRDGREFGETLAA